MIKAHNIRLNPTPEQAVYFARAAGTARFCFNWGRAEWKRQYEAGEKPSALSLKKQFNAIKREQFPWVYDLTKCVVEGAFMDLGTAFKNFVEGIKAGRLVGYPTFKSKRKSKPSFYLANDKFTVGNHCLLVPKLGRVNMAEKLRFSGKILSARISRTADWWYVSITIEMADITPTPRREPVIGIDVGMSRLATVSDGRVFENQKPLRHLLRKLAHTQRTHARRQKGSANREKARRTVARVHARIARKREDILHKLSAAVAKGAGTVGIEDLRVKNLVKNHCLALSLSDASLGRMLDLIEGKVRASGGTLVKVDPFFPSSKRCSCCGVKNPDLTLADRVYVCINPDCLAVLDRDLNASINLAQEAVRLLGPN